MPANQSNLRNCNKPLLVFNKINESNAFKSPTETKLNNMRKEFYLIFYLILLQIISCKRGGGGGGGLTPGLKEDFFDSAVRLAMFLMDAVVGRMLFQLQKDAKNYETYVAF